MWKFVATINVRLPLRSKLYDMEMIWSTIKEDAKELVKKYDTCQYHGYLNHVLVEQQIVSLGYVISFNRE